jgi:hypothetical protein
MNFTVMQLIIMNFTVMFLIGYVCLYSLVDRIMKCIEHCATAKAYSKFREAGAMPTMHDVSLGISEEKNGEKRLN